MIIEKWLAVEVPWVAIVSHMVAVIVFWLPAGSSPPAGVQRDASEAEK